MKSLGGGGNPDYRRYHFGYFGTKYLFSMPRILFWQPLNFSPTVIKLQTHLFSRFTTPPVPFPHFQMGITIFVLKSQLVPILFFNITYPTPSSFVNVANLLHNIIPSRAPIFMFLNRKFYLSRTPSTEDPHIFLKKCISSRFAE